MERLLEVRTPGLAVCPTGAISIFGHCPKDSIPPVQADEASPVMDALIANRHSCRRYQDAV